MKWNFLEGNFCKSIIQDTDRILRWSPFVLSQLIFKTVIIIAHKHTNMKVQMQKLLFLAPVQIFFICWSLRTVVDMAKRHVNLLSALVSAQHCTNLSNFGHMLQSKTLSWLQFNDMQLQHIHDVSLKGQAGRL